MRLLAVLCAALALVGSASALAAQPKASLPDIEDEVMCVECGTALNISQSAAADGERRFIKRRIADGLTKEQIKSALVAEYGRNVLGEPPDKGFARAIYIVPIALALLAAGGIALTARRWRHTPAPAGTEQTAAPSDRDRERLERDMAGYDL